MTPLPAPIHLPLLNWYSQHARILPWRGVQDPYRVWVSEIMLQQTRVDTVIPYYERWMERFPTIDALAAASQQEVLAAWEGLGYYNRARNLHRAAQFLVDQYNGQLPADIHQLRKLPGVGRYTAGAIASIAFGLDQPALEGNIRRVLSRLFDITDDARSTVGEWRLWQMAEEHLPPGRAGEYNQALMDLGALICTPRAPDCPRCPLAEGCQARALGVQEQRPVTRPRPAIPHYTVTAAVIFGADSWEPDLRVLLAQRPAEGLLGGLWEFPGGKVEPGEELPACLQREICEELGVEIDVGESLGVYRHAFTHFRVTLHAFRCSLRAPPEGNNPALYVQENPAPYGRGYPAPIPRPIQVADIRWVKLDELANYPMGKIDRQIARRLNSNKNSDVS